MTLSHPWVRFLTPQIPAAGYFTLSNDGHDAAVLTGATSPDCAALMLHESTTNSGVAQMQMMRQVAVPAHASVSFRPGGYHLMCMSPASAIHPGAHLPVTLHFRDGTSLHAEFPVYGAKGP